MWQRLGTLLIAAGATALLFFIMLVPRPAGADTNQTPCDEWANFTKIITYKFRDYGQPREAVKAELKRVMPGHPDLDVGLAWIDFSFDHAAYDSVKVWELAYEECRAKRGVK
jgi:hypothetical protein